MALSPSIRATIRSLGDLPSMQTLVGDAMGGSTASLVMIVRNMAFGALIFLPFGADYIPVGIAAGLASLLVANIGSAFAARSPFICVATFSLSALMMMSMNEYVLSQLLDMKMPDPIPIAILFCFMATIFAGFFQMCFGLLRIGNLAKYIPYPVLSGLLNGTGVAIVISQLKVIIAGQELTAASANLWAIVAVCVISAATVVLGPRLLPRVPGAIIAILIGTAAYYLFELLIADGSLGAVVGPVPSTLTLPWIDADFGRLVAAPGMGNLAATVMLFAFGIGAADTLRAALSCLMVDLKTQTRSDFNRELLSEGIGNILAGLFGGVTSTGNATGALANLAHGGTTRLSRLFVGLVVLFVILFLGPLLAGLPHSVLATIMIAMTVAIMDFGFVRESRQLLLEGVGNRREILASLILNLLVAFLVIVVDLFAALAVGLASSVVLFVLRMSKRIVKTQYLGNEIPSHVMRDDIQQEFLAGHSHRTRILELEGALFFGTADKLHDQLDPLLRSRDVATIIIDLKSVTQIDGTAADILRQCAGKAANAGKQFVISSIDIDLASERFPEMLTMLLRHQIEFCEHLEDAVAEAEDELLRNEFGGRHAHQEIELSGVNILSDLSEAQLQILRGQLFLRELKSGELLIRQGDFEQILYFIVKGQGEVFIESNGVPLRISTVCTGTVVGEMSLFDAAPRSANVRAYGELSCYGLNLKGFESLTKSHPEVIHKVLVGLNRMYAGRLRVANNTISRLRR